MKKLIFKAALMIMLGASSLFGSIDNSEDAVLFTKTKEQLKDSPIVFTRLPLDCKNGKMFYFPLETWNLKIEKFNKNVLNFIKMINVPSQLPKSSLKKLLRDFNKNIFVDSNNNNKYFCVNEKEKE